MLIFKTIASRGLIFSPVIYTYYENVRKTSESPSDFSCYFKRIKSQTEDRYTLCPYKLSWEEERVKPVIDQIFLQLEADFKQSKDLSLISDILVEHIKKENQPDTNAYVARKLILFLRRRIVFNSVETLTSYLYYRIHPASTTFSELKKTELQILAPLFHFANQMICTLEDQQLVEEIKVLFSNLPFKGDRAALSHLFLSEEEQVKMMCKALQKKEDALVEKIIHQIQKQSIYFSANEERILRKLLFSEQNKESYALKAELSPENKVRLIDALEKISQNKKNRGIQSTISRAFEEIDAWDKETLSILPEGSAKMLQRVLKSKSFFQEQLNSPPIEIAIPFWYHSTKKERAYDILDTGKLNVYYRKGEEPGYTGAWVSSRIDSFLFGRYTIGFSKKIEELEEDIRTSHLFHTHRWRGFMQPLPLKDVSVIAIKQDKANRKQEKEALAKKLEEMHPSSYKVISEQQMIFMQKMIVSTLGHPNLSDRLWSHNFNDYKS